MKQPAKNSRTVNCEGRNYMHHWPKWVREMEAKNKARDESMRPIEKLKDKSK